MVKVFLVEDEIVIRENICQMVPWAEYGFELCGEAGDGEMALPLILEKKPDVLITDIRMPFMDGLELSQIVRKELPDTKIVIVSGYDDFNYARTAITIGVEEYLLKPVSRQDFVDVLEKIRGRFEEENAQRDYYEKFEKDMQQYEQYSRRDFFEKLVSGNVGLNEIYRQAEQLQIDLTASSYNIILFSMNRKEKREAWTDTYSQKETEVWEQVERFIQDREEFLMFRHQAFSYAILVKGAAGRIEALTEECALYLKSLFEKSGGRFYWFLASGNPVGRLSMVSESYENAIKVFTLRHLRPDHYMHYNQTPFREEEDRDVDLQAVDASAMDTEVVHTFLSNGLLEETGSFVEDYFSMIGEPALEFRMFRQYVILNIHFCTVSFIQKLGYGKEQLRMDLGLDWNRKDQVAAAKRTAEEILKKGIELRDESSKNRYRTVLEVALEFIGENYMDADMSLNKAARAANVSANHFSALFSQGMNQTFIEYLTELRMKKAKELLRCTDMRSGQIALEIGYKDSHYFSFLFKKTQGCTPSDYRNQTGETK